MGERDVNIQIFRKYKPLFKKEISKKLKKAKLTQISDHVILKTLEQPKKVLKIINSNFPKVSIVGYGRSIEIFKQVGNPKDVVKKFKLDSFSGTHGIGHTRMATESAITTDGSHPYSTGEDECLVHNGSLSNHNNLRRELTKKGNVFNSENDTEVAAGYVSNSLSNATVYPNPTKGDLFISNNRNINLERVAVFDVSGRLIAQKDISSTYGLNTIHLNSVSNGIYFVNIYSDTTYITKKITLE